MRLLVLGGTRFLGRHLVERARARGDTVTILHRGRTNAGLFAGDDGVETLLGDRDADLSVLDGRRWDAVVDTCGYLPRQVEAAARRLAPAAGHYTFVSSISVLADTSTPGLDESAPVAPLPAGADPAVFVPEHYGALKASCEHACAASFAGTVLVVRPGLIAGPHDPTDRFTYWLRRLARGGEVLAPDASQPIQVVDARDLAGWMLAMVARGASGTYHATSPARPIGAFLDEVRAGSDAPAGTSLVHVGDAFLAEHDVTPWTGLPLWLPADHHGFLRQSVTKALEAGLTPRPLAETARDTLDWDRTRPPGEISDLGPGPRREAQLIAAWRERTR